MDRVQRRARVLVIEDDPIIALTLEDILGDGGFDVVGIAATLAQALAKIASCEIDVAIVDANLDEVSASPAASALNDAGVPYVVLSGYSADQLRAAFPGAVFLRKPSLPTEIIRSLNSIISERSLPSPSS